MDTRRAAAAGIIATASMTALLMVEPSIGLPKIAIGEILSSSMSAVPSVTAIGAAGGWVIDAILGIAFALIYAKVSERPASRRRHCAGSAVRMRAVRIGAADLRAAHRQRRVLGRRSRAARGRAPGSPRLRRRGGIRLRAAPRSPRQRPRSRVRRDGGAATVGPHDDMVPCRGLRHKTKAILRLRHQADDRIVRHADN